MSWTNKIQHRPLASFIAIALLFLPCLHAQSEDYTPWALRDHYSFSSDNAAFKYDVKSAEWMLDIKVLGALVQDAQCEIEFTNGEILRLSTLEAVSDDRKKFSGPMGDGTYFRSVFKTDKSLEITFTVARLKDQSFMLFNVALENHSNTPINIRSIRPVVLDPGSTSSLGRPVNVTRYSFKRRGVFPLLQSDQTTSLMQFKMDDPEVTMAIGLLQTGIMNSHINIDRVDSSWEGAIHCDFDPSVQIKPGQKIGTDSIWLSFSVPQIRDVLRLHTWAQSTDAPMMNPKSKIPAWITTDPKQDAQALYTAAQQWADTNINHVLIPPGWQSNPGSLRGAKPNYPPNIGHVAKEIQALGMRPGITITPLALQNSNSDLTIQAKDGTHWLNVTSKNAVTLGVQQIQKLIEQGFQFLVVPTSNIPDDVLKQLNVTRSQADGLALEIAARAAQGRPVYPAAELTLNQEILPWQEAATATAFFEEYGMLSGPVRLHLDTLPEISPTLARAISQYSGPIEFVGQPTRKIRRALNTINIGSTQAAQTSAR